MASYVVSLRNIIINSIREELRLLFEEEKTKLMFVCPPLNSKVVHDN